MTHIIITRAGGAPMTRRIRSRAARSAAGAAAVAALTLAMPAVADHGRAPRTATPPLVTATGCEEHEAWVEGDPAAVAQRLPHGYTPVITPSGKPLVFARAEHCRAVTTAGRTAPATIADWGVVVGTPDGHGCATGVPIAGSVKGDVPPACNWYTLSLVSDDRRVVD